MWWFKCAFYCDIRSISGCNSTEWKIPRLTDKTVSVDCNFFIYLKRHYLSTKYFFTVTASKTSPVLKKSHVNLKISYILIYPFLLSNWIGSNFNFSISCWNQKSINVKKIIWKRKSMFYLTNIWDLGFLYHKLCQWNFRIYFQFEIMGCQKLEHS